MCGIAGIAFQDPSRKADRNMLQRMAAIQRHRGPDSEGLHVTEGAGLALRRLSIIDPETGDQPITNEDGSVAVVCNGEIYNYIELRERLLKAGHTFRTRSDVEVIAHLYEDDPEGFPDQLRGMFGLAIWDARRRTLLLARDRLGIKPLHYAITPEALIFASELKGVLAAGLVSPAPDAAAFRDLFTLGFVRSPRTLVAGVKRLLPGQRVVYTAGSATKSRYWDITFPAKHEYDRRLTTEEWAAGLREKLEESVRLHLRSDVPVGAWLSAGIDSSAVAALMSRQLQHPVPTFTLGFENPGVDELAGNLLLDECREFGLIGHRTWFDSRHFTLLPQAVWHREQPFGIGTDVSLWLIAQLAAQQVKVVLTGEGSDENLGGYAWYRSQQIFGPLRKMPRALRHTASRLLAAAGRRTGSAILAAPPGNQLDSFVALSGSPTLLNSTPQVVQSRWLEADAADMEDGPTALPEAFHSWHPFAQLQYLDLKLRLPEVITHRVDLFSMAHSLEARVPFLDHPLVEFCALIPPEVKMRRLTEKHVLRCAMRDVLPPAILRRRKRPLTAPTRDLVDAALPEYEGSLLSPAELRNRGWFEPHAVAELLAAHRSGRADHSWSLLMILTTQMWDEQFLKARPADESQRLEGRK